jgi:EAL domain-containing protein (putative c-di-GMP-specific phosphodiesterase class I)
MQSVDRWVINKAFSWLENHHTEINNTGISINLSAQSMDDEKFFSFISNHLDSSPFPNNKITFEITESSLIKHVDQARMLVEKIKEKGCKFSLDDFGTGYASYSYLKDFPVDHVKIDGIFIKDILTEDSSYAMVKSITEVSHHMGKKVVAEYVESEAVLGALREIEVDFAQGYYVGHPVPIKNLIQAEQYS